MAAAISEQNRTRAQRARAVYQSELRDRLSKGKHLEHVIEIVEEVRNVGVDIPPEHLARLKFVVDTKLKLIAKYLPDLKAIEVTGGDGGPLTGDWTVRVIQP